MYGYEHSAHRRAMAVVQFSAASTIAYLGWRKANDDLSTNLDGFSVDQGWPKSPLANRAFCCPGQDWISAYSPNAFDCAVLGYDHVEHNRASKPPVPGCFRIRGLYVPDKFGWRTCLAAGIGDRQFKTRLIPDDAGSGKRVGRHGAWLRSFALRVG